MQTSRNNNLKTPKLEVLVATLGSDGLRRFAASEPPVVAGVEFVVSCQHPDSDSAPTVPESLRNRDDVRVIFSRDRGLSNNRNNLFSHARAPLFLIADDDLTFVGAGLEAVIKAFETMPEADILTFRYDGPSLKRYPPDGHPLSRRWKKYYVSSIEIGGRLESVKRARLSFSPLAGIGAPVLTAGEEAFFIRRALKRGLRVVHCAVTVAAHPGLSTGQRQGNAGFLKSRGAVIVAEHPLTAIPRIAWRAFSDRHTIPPVKHFVNMIKGAGYALRHRPEL